MKPHLRPTPLLNRRGGSYTPPAPPAGTAGQPIGLLLILTKAA